MSNAQCQLLQLLLARSFQPGSFRLASGDQTDHFFDSKLSLVYSGGAFLIGEVLYEKTRDLDMDAIGGLEDGAVSLTTAAVISYHLHGQDMEGFWVRDRARGRPIPRTIKGYLLPGARVVLVDDVVTRGSSVLQAAKAVWARGCTVVAVVALIDRMVGASGRLLQHGISDYRPVFTTDDLRASASRDEAEQISCW